MQESIREPCYIVCPSAIPSMSCTSYLNDLRDMKQVAVQLLFCGVRLIIEKILRKNQNGFQRNRSTTSQILTVKFLKVYVQKNLKATILFVNFAKAFDSMHRGKMEQILLTHGLPKETITAIMILYRNIKVSLLPGWRHRLLRHCCRCAARRNISPIPLLSV